MTNLAIGKQPPVERPQVVLPQQMQPRDRHRLPQELLVMGLAGMPEGERVPALPEAVRCHPRVDHVGVRPATGRSGLGEPPPEQAVQPEPVA